MNPLQILLFILCIIDLWKNKKILSPRFLFNFIFFVSTSLYSWQLSEIQHEISDRTELILVYCVVFFNMTYLIFEKYFSVDKMNEFFKKVFTKIKIKKFNFSIDKKIKIARNISIIIFLVELLYSKGCPLIWKFIGDSKTYLDFGISSLNGAFCGLIICLGAYSIFNKTKDKYIYLLMAIMMISRQVIMSMLIEGMIYFIISNKNKINYKKIGIIFVIVFIGFTMIGNFRSGDNTMDHVFMPKEKYKGLPNSLKWTYSYVTFSISNFNNLANKTDGGMNHGSSMLYEFLPTVLLDKINIENEYDEEFIINPAYNVSTYLPSIYLDFGIIGIIIFNSIIAFVGYLLFNNLNSKKNILLYAVYSHNIILLLFSNMFLYLPVLVQFIYIPLIFGGGKDEK